ncbi:MAG: hypothetical protein JOZ41_01135, partial [Chloroflexi bacterium]|nr:hypothetical protein [Chloroflexota bacterium]
MIQIAGPGRGRVESDDRLVGATKAAVRVLGAALLAHPRSCALRTAVSSGSLDPGAYYRQLLRLAYRLLFLLVLEVEQDSAGSMAGNPAGALGGRPAHPRRWVAAAPSPGTVPPAPAAEGGRFVAGVETNGRATHGDDLWQAQLHIFRELEGTGEASRLSCPALAGDFFSPGHFPDVAAASCDDAGFDGAVTSLRAGIGTDRSATIDQLGLLHELMLDCSLRLAGGSQPRVELATGTRRREAGAYYSPGPLVNELVRTALIPVVERRLDAARGAAERERALLDIRVCDPACGSGAFLHAAARHLAVELSLLRRGDDRRNGATSSTAPPDEHRGALADVIGSCICGVDLDACAVDLCKMTLWLASGRSRPPMSELDDHIRCGDALVGAMDLSSTGIGAPAGESPAAARARMKSACDRWAAQHCRLDGVEGDAGFEFFHWPVEFDDIVRRGGFDVVLTNPPWELLQPQEVEFFRTHDRHDIAAAPGVERKASIRDLPARDARLARLWEGHRRAIAARCRFVRASGRYPLASGRLNTYALFVETIRAILHPTGRAGCIVPSGIGTDEGSSRLFERLMTTGELRSLYHFDNLEELFPAIGRNITFCLLTLEGRHSTPVGRTDVAFFLHRVAELQDPGRRIALSREDVVRFNPNTRTCPIIRSRRDLEIARAIYDRVPVLVDEGGAPRDSW